MKNDKAPSWTRTVTHVNAPKEIVIHPSWATWEASSKWKLSTKRETGNGLSDYAKRSAGWK